MALSVSPQEIVASGEYQLLGVAPHWERVPLHWIADVQNGFPFPSELFDREKGKPLIRIRDVNRGFTEHRFNGDYDPKFIVRHGDILVGMDGDFRAARWQGEDALLNQRVCRIAPSTNLYSERFLFLCLQPYLDAINAETSSVTVKHLSSRTVQDIPLPLPPLPEQHRIVAKIEELFSELDASEESLTRARAQLGLYRQSLLKAAFQGKLTADWRAANPDKLESPEALLSRIRKEREDRYRQALEDWQTALSEWRAKGEVGRKPPKPERPSDFALHSDATSLPEAWVVATVESLLAEPLSNGRSVKDREGGFPVLRLSAFRDGRLDLTARKPGDWTEEEAEPWIVQEGDFFAARGNGSKHLVGIGALAANVTDRVAYPDTMIRLAVDTAVVDPLYFAQVWNSRIMRDQIEGAARTTAGIYKINQPHICGFAFPLPPLPEQKVIVGLIEPVLSQVEHQEQEISTALAKITALRQSILKKAFAGELVPQDPADEPASALLARIRAEAPAQSSRRKKTA